MRLVSGFQTPLVHWLLDDKNINGKHVDKDGGWDHPLCRILDHQLQGDQYPEHAHVSDFYVLFPSGTRQEIIQKNEPMYGNVSQHIYLHYLLAKNR